MEEIRDDEGILVTDIQSALIYAMEVVQEIRAGDPISAAEWTGGRLEVTDTTGRVIGSLCLDGSCEKNTFRH